MDPVSARSRAELGAELGAELLAQLDLGDGVSAEMLLGALVDVGVPMSVLHDAVGALGLPVELQHCLAWRGGVVASWVITSVTRPQASRRSTAEVHELLSTLPEAVRGPAVTVFEGLSGPDGSLEQVGSDDAVAQVVGACAAVHWLRERGQVTSLGSGPAGPGSTALGLALVAALTDEQAGPPDDVTGRSGAGAGNLDLSDRPHVVRLTLSS